MDVVQEYERIRKLFADADEGQVALLDGTIREAARLRIELDKLNQIVRQSGLIKVNPQNPLQQKELPVAKMIVRVRANYLNYMMKLANVLGKRIDDDDLGLDDYE